MTQPDTIKIKDGMKKYSDSHCTAVVDHLKRGLSIQTFGATVGVSRATVYEWIDNIPEFKDAVEIGKQLAQQFFENRLAAKISGQEIKGIDTKKIDTACLIFALKTRFHETYGEKVQVTGADGAAIAINIAKDDESL
jgi:predicted DNA-binding transcriptional regulator AlpA